MSLVKSIIISFIIVIVLANACKAQTIITTPIGQKVAVNEEGIVNKVLLEEKEVSPFELPTLISSLDPAYKIKLDKLSDKVKIEDIVLFNEKNVSITKLKEAQVQLAQADKIQNKLLSEKFSKVIAAEKRLQDENLKKYKELIKINKSINDLYELSDNNELLKTIDKLYSTHVIKTEVFNGLNAKEPINTSLPVDTKLAIDERNPWDITAKNYLSNGQEPLISYTPAKLKNYYKEEQMVEGYGKVIVENEKNYFLELKLIFKSKDAQKGYGQINKKDFAKLNFIKGRSIFVLSDQTYTATIEQLTGNTIYKARFKFRNKGDIKKALEYHLDTIGILWSSGYEEYPVYNTDLLMRQIKI